MKDMTQARISRKRGASAMTYALLVGLISVVALAAVSNIGGNVDGLMSNVSGKLGDSVVASGGIGSGSPAPSASASPSPAFSFTSHSFTDCGAGPGPDGPDLVDCTAAYSGQSWSSNTSFFNITQQGKQQFTIPQTGTYRITAAGAQGANVGSRTGGAGAAMRADYSLTQGDILTIAVGQTGLFGEDGAGGGGGSFVVLNSGSQPLLVAGGGGGAEAHGADTNNGGPGQTTTAGGQEVADRVDNERGVINPGSNGSGGDAGRASGGAGWSGDGAHGCHTNAASGCGGSYSVGGGFSWANGLGGGVAPDLTDGANGQIPHGGFGGGGQGSRHNGYGGGGGGYSGGVGGGYDGLESAGGGGGSYIASGGSNVATSNGQYENSGTFEGNPIGSISPQIGNGTVQVEFIP